MASECESEKERVTTNMSKSVHMTEWTNCHNIEHHYSTVFETKTEHRNEQKKKKKNE